MRIVELRTHIKSLQVLIPPHLKVLQSPLLCVLKAADPSSYFFLCSPGPLTWPPIWYRLTLPPVRTRLFAGWEGHPIIGPYVVHSLLLASPFRGGGKIGGKDGIIPLSAEGQISQVG